MSITERLSPRPLPEAAVPNSEGGPSVIGGAGFVQRGWVASTGPSPFCSLIG